MFSHFFYHKKNNFDLIPICITTRSKHSTQVQVVFFFTMELCVYVKQSSSQNEKKKPLNKAEQAGSQILLL
jgi:hypothetical protein